MSYESIQCAVKKGLEALRHLNERASEGRVESQCGVHGGILVKKCVDWPQYRCPPMMT